MSKRRLSTSDDSDDEEQELADMIIKSLKRNKQNKIRKLDQSIEKIKNVLEERVNQVKTTCDKMNTSEINSFNSEIEKYRKDLASIEQRLTESVKKFNNEFAQAGRSILTKQKELEHLKDSYDRQAEKFLQSEAQHLKTLREQVSNDLKSLTGTIQSLKSDKGNKSLKVILDAFCREAGLSL
eukprot:NODE_7682_length_752_cov_15.990461_g7068_i0.p1 GENE.NODE_7682_length_752_cov_15.990461_g7068_i0~~NODE_7682_length_752_cov_15.990461_g7068_i0.p1  ORF type:complete len:182 (-),score=40.53 NODE_7682_length_752_cov_15.990461_g7068_i0:154-699(-)